MKKLITKLKSLKMLALALVLGAGFFNVQGQAPWCNSDNAYQLYYSATSYVNCAEQVRVTVGSTVLWNKPADGWNYAGVCGSEYRLANTPAKAKARPIIFSESIPISFAALRFCAMASRDLPVEVRRMPSAKAIAIENPIRGMRSCSALMRKPPSANPCCSKGVV